MLAFLRELGYLLGRLVFAWELRTQRPSGVLGREGVFGLFFFLPLLPPSPSSASALSFLVWGPARACLPCLLLGVLAGPRRTASGPALQAFFSFFLSSALSARVGLRPRSLSLLCLALLSFSCTQELFLASTCHQPLPFTSLPFARPTRRSYRLSVATLILLASPSPCPEQVGNFGKVRWDGDRFL